MSRSASRLLSVMTSSRAFDAGRRRQDHDSERLGHAGGRRLADRHAAHRLADRLIEAGLAGGAQDLEALNRADRIDPQAHGDAVSRRSRLAVEAERSLDAGLD